MRTHLRVTLVIALALATLVAAGCGRAAEPLDPPAQAIQSLLELRAERSTDASAYAEFLGTPELAVELARASAEETSQVPPTPDWEPPYVSDETTETADVVVVWSNRNEYPDWPKATIFEMHKLEEAWLAFDARAVGETETVPARP